MVQPATVLEVGHDAIDANAFRTRTPVVYLFQSRFVLELSLDGAVVGANLCCVLKEAALGGIHFVYLYSYCSFFSLVLLVPLSVPAVLCHKLATLGGT